MIVPINVASFSSNSKLPSGLAKISNDEVVLIELQGSLEVECTHNTESDGKLVGKLNIDESNVSSVNICISSHHMILWSQNKPTLLIGHHLLEGKIMTLAKPLAVLYRSHVNKMDVDDGEKLKDPARWDIVAIVKQKIIFSKRPMPVVGRATIP